MSGNNENSDKKGFGVFASSRVIFGFVIAVGCLWLAATVISFFKGSPSEKSQYEQLVDSKPYMKKVDKFVDDFEEFMEPPPPVAHEEENIIHLNKDIVPGRQDLPEKTIAPPEDTTAGHGKTVAAPRSKDRAPADTHGTSGHGDERAVYSDVYERESYHPRQVVGTEFVDALIAPLEYELEERFWGWRPNDIFLFKFFMDNVEHYQLGVREVTRRSADILAERIARTGSNVSFNKHLNDAVNSLTVSPESYWWPSAEGEYKRAIKNLKKYKEQLLAGEESFYTRPDNLIPLLVEFRTRLGDCDDKLVRREGDKDSQVSTFEADNRFYYSQGVASAILPILEAVEVDFHTTLKTRGGLESLHHAIESLNGAVNMDPWMVTEGDYNGFIANHRANMATYISHARFYLGVLIKTLST